MEGPVRDGVKGVTGGAGGSGGVAGGGVLADSDSWMIVSISADSVGVGAAGGVTGGVGVGGGGTSGGFSAGIRGAEGRGLGGGNGTAGGGGVSSCAASFICPAPFGAGLDFCAASKMSSGISFFSIACSVLPRQCNSSAGQQ